MKTKLFVLMALTLALCPAALGQGATKEEISQKLIDTLRQRPVNVAQALELIRQGAEVNVYSGMPMLNWAIPTKSIEIVKALLEAGADPNKFDAQEGKSALHEAAGYNVPPAMIALLIQFKADPNREAFDGRVPLHYIASFAGDAGIAVELVKGGALPYIKTKYGRTPFDIAAASEGRADVAAAMRAAGGAPAVEAEVASIENKPSTPLVVESDEEEERLLRVVDYVLERQRAEGYKLMDEGFAETQGRNSNDPSIGVKQAIFPREMTRFFMISTDGIMINAVMNTTLLTIPCTGGCQTSISTYITAFGNQGLLDGYKVQFLDVTLINFQNNFIDYILKTGTPGSQVKWMYFKKIPKRS